MPDIKERIAAKAKEVGFDTVGFATPALSTLTQAGLHEFIAGGYHGDMEWMEDKADRRASPKTLWPEVQSIIMVGHNYGPAFDPMEKLQHTDQGIISAYALNEDYHDVMKKRLKQLAGWLAQTYECEVKIFVDTAPVMEKPLAEQAGIGWQGKHTCLVSREFGSWLFLGTIFTTLAISSPSPLVGEGRGEEVSSPNALNTRPPLPNPLPQGERVYKNHCGSCSKCLDICPTQAFTASGKLDARKCIAYLTIEHKGQIPLEFRKAIGNRIYGCDDCLAVCPWNKFAQATKDMAYHPRKSLESPLLKDLVQLDDAAFRSMFSKSPVKRLGRERFVRNVLVAIGNSSDPSLIPTITPLLEDEKFLVKDMAIWALGELEKCPI